MENTEKQKVETICNFFTIYINRLAYFPTVWVNKGIFFFSFYRGLSSIENLCYNHMKLLRDKKLSTWLQNSTQLKKRKKKNEGKSLAEISWKATSYFSFINLFFRIAVGLQKCKAEDTEVTEFPYTHSLTYYQQSFIRVVHLLQPMN